MTIRRCCCNDCGSADCSAVREDCAAVGLRPFTVDIGVTMVKASCRKLSAEEIFCDNENCGSWGESPCGGCIPCDPDGSMPGANGRKCPCPTDTCAYPPGVHLPYQVCEQVDPTTFVDGCRYLHTDYFYITWRPQGNSDCLAPIEPVCPWLGSHSCSFELVRVPAGFSFVPCEALHGVAFNLDVDSLAVCRAPGTHALPWPTDAGHYGWPHDCEFSPPPCGGFEFGGCMCQCVGVFPTWKLQDEPNYGCDPLGNSYSQLLYARINWAVPCSAGSDFGGILACGDQCPCDTDRYSYVSITFFGTSSRAASNVVGSIDYTFVDPNDPAAVAERCTALVGDPSTTLPGSECAGAPRVGNGGPHCQDQCCLCQFQETVIMRRLRNPGDDACRMAAGKYEVAGIDACGELLRSGCGTKTCAYNAQCAPKETWDKALESIGITYLNFEIH